MPISNYSILKAKVVDSRFASGANPHYQIKVVDDDNEYRIAVNVRSQDGSDLQYVLNSQWSHPIQDDLDRLELGLHGIQNRPGGTALDYIRANVVDPRLFVTIPMNLPGPDNDLNEKLNHYVQRAMADESAILYSFGEPWGPENKRDKIFGFKPGNGIHNIHQNQGNSPRFQNDDGVWQDGGLLFHFPQHKQWVAIFLRFQNQSWHTDDTTGHAIKVPTSGPPSDDIPSEPLTRESLPTSDRPDGLVRIIAALVNDTNSPEIETVTLLNTSNSEISLEGWSIADKQKNKMYLNGKLSKGEAKALPISKPAVLSNKGGIITLLDEQGLKVHGVSYTHSQARHSGWTIKF